MKTLRVLSLLSLFPIASAVANPSQGQPGKLATTRAELAERLKTQGANASAVAAPEEQQPRWDLSQHAEFITFNGDSTLVPKKAILHLPEKYAGNVVQAAKGKVISWLDFASKYPALVTPIEVTLENASAQTPVDPALIEAVSKSGRIGVAVLSRSPISVATPPPAPGQ